MSDKSDELMLGKKRVREVKAELDSASRKLFELEKQIKLKSDDLYERTKDRIQTLPHVTF